MGCTTKAVFFALSRTKHCRFPSMPSACKREFPQTPGITEKQLKNSTQVYLKGSMVNQLLDLVALDFYCKCLFQQSVKELAALEHAQKAQKNWHMWGKPFPNEPKVIRFLEICLTRFFEPVTNLWFEVYWSISNIFWWSKRVVGAVFVKRPILGMLALLSCLCCFVQYINRVLPEIPAYYLRIPHVLFIRDM